MQHNIFVNPRHVHTSVWSFAKHANRIFSRIYFSKSSLDKSNCAWYLVLQNSMHWSLLPINLPNALLNYEATDDMLCDFHTARRVHINTVTIPLNNKQILVILCLHDPHLPLSIHIRTSAGSCGKLSQRPEPTRQDNKYASMHFTWY